MIILGIETSCDETALAIIETRTENGIFECRVIQSLVHSQAELHSAYGGVFPALAKREHGKNLIPLLKKLLLESAGALDEISTQNHSSVSALNAAHPKIAPKGMTDEQLATALAPFRADLKATNPDLCESLQHADFLKHISAIDRIAVTEGPGLEPTLWVGISFARMLSALWNVPIIPVNHMEGHIVGSLLPSDAPYGAWQKLHQLPPVSIALLISGGHTELVKIETMEKADQSSDKIEGKEQATRIAPGFKYTIIGRTKDDAVGEAYDKAARLLGLPYPGGPHISKLAHEAWQEGIGSPVPLPRPMIKSGDLDFSFSGLKTAVLYAIRDAKEVTDDFRKGLAYEFEQAVAETLSFKLRAGIDAIGAQAIVVGGGVSANHLLRKRFTDIAREYGIPLYLPSHHISGDNALMIALAGALDTASHKRELRAQGTKKLGSE